jgi:putative membrane protein
VSTLVVCVDRSGGLTASGAPVVGRAAVESLVTEAGVEDPEDSWVNCLLETLRVARDLEADGDEAVVAVVSGVGPGVSADRAVARQVDALVADHDPDSAVVVIDSAVDERLVPIVESRVRVDAVDRVVVRQAHDIESTYYLLKQFLADEELRATVLVPIGAALLVFPVLLTLASPAVAVSTITAVIGLFLLYKGLGVDDWLAALPGMAREAFYSGQVSLVTYVVAAGLVLVGTFAGVIGASSVRDAGAFVVGMQFVFDSILWIALGALAASTGRLIDELLDSDHGDEETIPSAFLSLPFGVVAIGLVIRGFSAYFLERAGIVDALTVPATNLGPVAVRGIELAVGTRLAVYVLGGILVAVVGVQFASYMEDTAVDEELPE